MTFSRHLLGQPAGPGTWTCPWTMDRVPWFIASCPSCLPVSVWSWPALGCVPSLCSGRQGLLWGRLGCRLRMSSRTLPGLPLGRCRLAEGSVHSVGRRGGRAWMPVKPNDALGGCPVRRDLGEGLGACFGNTEWNRLQNSGPQAGPCGIPSLTFLPDNHCSPAHPAPPLGTLLEAFAG